MGIKKKIRIFLDKFIKPVILNYTKVDRRYRYKSLKLIVRPGIFHPKYFNSTRTLLNYLQNTKLDHKTLLDVGTGSGILALFAADKGAIVTASDISKKAIENATYNARLNNININIIESDLFDNIKPQVYEIIIINPPYYPKNPEVESDYAWYCGEGFEYYHKLFSQIKPYLNMDSRVIVSLAETCDINKIDSIAKACGFNLKLIDQKNYLWEKQLLFRICN
jgi:release factor glutamine methyltransferase